MPSGTDGSETLPVKSTCLVLSSWMKKINGLLAMNSNGVSDSSPNLFTIPISVINNLKLDL